MATSRTLEKSTAARKDVQERPIAKVVLTALSVNGDSSKVEGETTALAGTQALPVDNNYEREQMPGTEKKKAQDRERMRAKRANGGWQEISTVPIGNQVLVWEPDYGWLLALKHHLYGWQLKSSGNFYGSMPREVFEKLEYWQPLPNPPSKAQKDRADE